MSIIDCNAGDLGSIPGSGRSPGEGNGNPLHYSCQEIPSDRRAWWAAVCGVTRVGHNLATNTLLTPQTMLLWNYICKSYHVVCWLLLVLTSAQLYAEPGRAVCRSGQNTPPWKQLQLSGSGSKMQERNEDAGFAMPSILLTKFYKAVMLGVLLLFAYFFTCKSFDMLWK